MKEMKGPSVHFHQTGQKFQHHIHWNGDRYASLNYVIMWYCFSSSYLIFIDFKKNIGNILK